MKLDLALFEDAVRRLAQANGGQVGSASPQFVRWLDSLPQLPLAFVAFLKAQSPRTELWAGAGSIFDEATIMARNTDFKEALESGLFIIGSAPNGDLVTVDLREAPGAVGYLMHENMYSVKDLRSLFVPICSSIGEFMSRINANEHDLPNDYFEAVANRQ